MSNLDRDWDLMYHAHGSSPRLAKTEHPFTIAVDLDGTILKKGEWKDEDHFEEPNKGAVEALRQAKEAGWRIIIHTCRGNTKRVEEELNKHDIPFDAINENPDQPEGTSDKPVADAYVDDRAVEFTDWASTMKQLKQLSKGS